MQNFLPSWSVGAATTETTATPGARPRRPHLVLHGGVRRAVRHPRCGRRARRALPQKSSLLAGTFPSRVASPDRDGSVSPTGRVIAARNRAR